MGEAGQLGLNLGHLAPSLGSSSFVTRLLGLRGKRAPPSTLAQNVSRLGARCQPVFRELLFQASSFWHPQLGSMGMFLARSSHAGLLHSGSDSLPPQPPGLFLPHASGGGYQNMIKDPVGRAWGLPVLTGGPGSRTQLRLL